MVTVRVIHAAGVTIIENADHVYYVRLCLYCDVEFQTENYNKKFCCDSHRVMYCQKGIAHAAH